MRLSFLAFLNFGFEKTRETSFLDNQASPNVVRIRRSGWYAVALIPWALAIAPSNFLANDERTISFLRNYYLYLGIKCITLSHNVEEDSSRARRGYQR